MIKRIKRPGSATTPPGLEKLKADICSIPVHIIFKSSERIFAEAFGTIILDSINDYDTKLIFNGVNVKSFLELQNLPGELEVTIYV